MQEDDGRRRVAEALVMFFVVLVVNAVFASILAGWF